MNTQSLAFETVPEVSKVAKEKENPYIKSGKPSIITSGMNKFRQAKLLGQSMSVKNICRSSSTILPGLQNNID